MHSKINILFRNDDNTYYNTISSEIEIIIFLTVHYYFKYTIQTTFLSYKITQFFYYSHTNLKIIIFLLFSIPLFLHYYLYNPSISKIIYIKILIPKITRKRN
jgi:hypothetical protein